MTRSASSMTVTAQTQEGFSPPVPSAESIPFILTFLFTRPLQLSFLEQPKRPSSLSSSTPSRVFRADHGEHTALAEQEGVCRLTCEGPPCRLFSPAEIQSYWLIYRLTLHEISCFHLQSNLQWQISLEK